MSILRRLAFVLGILPVSAYLFLRWICTGRDSVETWMRYEAWGTK